MTISRRKLSRNAKVYHRLVRHAQISWRKLSWVAPKPQNFVNVLYGSIETDTECYNQLVPWATWPLQHIYGLATTALAIKGSRVYLATVQTITVDRCQSILMLDIDHSDATLFLSNSSFILDTQHYHCGMCMTSKFVTVYNLFLIIS